MKAILEFELPEDDWDHRMALNGKEFALALNEVDNKIRNVIKHDIKGFAHPHDALEWVRETILGELTGRGVNFDMIY